MTDYLKRSRVTKALTDNGRAETFGEAEHRLDITRVTVVIGLDQLGTSAGQAAGLTAVATAFKCFGAVTLVADGDAELIAPLPIGRTLVAACLHLGADVVEALPGDTTHTVMIGNGGPARGWVLRCWWDRWLSGARRGVDDGPGDSRLPIAGVFAGAIAIRQVFSSVVAGRMLPPRDVSVSLWEPWSQADSAANGPLRFEVPNRLWFLGLGHLGQGYVWNLSLMPMGGCRFAVLQDDQSFGEENEATSLLVTASDIGKRKARVAAAWLDACGWETSILERRHHGDLPVRVDDPTYLLSGLDRLRPRQVMGRHGFEYMIDAGLGHGPGDFESLQIRVVPKGSSINELWSEQVEPSRVATGTAYGDLEQRIGACGTLPIAQASVAVPFVGAATGALVVAQAARLASLLPAVRFLQMELSAPGMPSLGGLVPAPAQGFGSYPMDLSAGPHAEAGLSAESGMESA